MEEYEEDDDTEDEEPGQPSTSAATGISSQQEEDDDKTEDEDEDPELTEWFNIKEKTSRSGIQRPVSDSETEADSDNEDVNEEDANATRDNIQKKLDAIRNNADGSVEVDTLALVIDGKSLTYALDPDMEKIFYDLAVMCKAVWNFASSTSSRP